MKGKFQNRVFGCDICQDVCPWNSKAKPQKLPFFEPKKDILGKSLPEWHNLSETEFQTLFRKSAIQRTKYIGFKRNLTFITE